MDLFQVLLILSTLLCSLVAGLVFAFAIIVMPGIKTLTDREFIRAFQVIDGVIQNNQFLFLLVWVGSALTLVVAAIFGIWQLSGISRVTLLLTAFTYSLGVQLPTITINIPLNNRLQALDTSSSDDVVLKQARENFESRWNFWNSFRTVLSTLVSVLLMILLVTLN